MENVGYAAKGKAGVYNILIMEEKQTNLWRAEPEQAPNASGPYRIRMVHTASTDAENVKDVGQYIARIDEMIERKQRLFEEK